MTERQAQQAIFAGIAIALATSIVGTTKKKPKVKPGDKKRAFVIKMWETANRLAGNAKWPRDLIITVAAHESRWGRSGLTQKANNLFGFKVSGGWLAKKKPYITMKTWEVINGKNIYVDAKFRKYDSWEESIADYIRLISTASRYIKAREAALQGDLRRYFAEVSKAGYATDPDYPKSLARVFGDVEAITA